jgi:Domain of unknown function (DUF4421)
MQYKNTLVYSLVLICIFLFGSNQLNAQVKKEVQYDSSYFQIYPNKLTTRFYFSQKYTSFSVHQQSAANQLQYRPNTTLNMGVGATWHNFSLNLAYGFGFLNRTTERGKTKYLDLQGHFYPHKWVVDWYGQLYKGFYISPGNIPYTPANAYYVRPDIHVNLFGIAPYYILNASRFSYNAGMMQNEWQKKSAGSLLLGGELYYSMIKGDSAFVPSAIQQHYAQKGINEIRYAGFGPGIGYAYTLVAAKHFFLMGSLAAAVQLNALTETGKLVSQQTVSVKPTYSFRMAAGYNSNSWNCSVNWVGNKTPMFGINGTNRYDMQTGNYRFIIAKKINAGPHLQKQLIKLNRILP